VAAFVVFGGAPGDLSTWHSFTTRSAPAMPSPKVIFVTLIIVVIGVALIFRSPLKKIVTGS
jgi:hypothetical protein